MLTEDHISESNLLWVKASNNIDLSGSEFPSISYSLTKLR